jgi:FdhD protein
MVDLVHGKEWGKPEPRGKFLGLWNVEPIDASLYRCRKQPVHGSHFRRRDVLILPAISVEMPRLSSDGSKDRRAVPEESPIALVYDGTTAAVVMATPADLTDLAIGFSLTEGIVKAASEIETVEIVSGSQGIELRVWLTAHSSKQFQKRQRRLVGPTGCGLCGIESLAEASRSFPRLPRQINLRSNQIERAMNALSHAQLLNHVTHATHAAGFYLPDDTLVAIREDVGRHNALDKLAGALATQEISGRSGAVLMTSRISIELVQKTAAMGCSILIAISAPTARAVRAAETYGVTLVAVARGSSFEIFSHPDGIRD